MRERERVAGCPILFRLYRHCSRFPRAYFRNSASSGKSERFFYRSPSGCEASTSTQLTRTTERKRGGESGWETTRGKSMTSLWSLWPIKSGLKLCFLNKLDRDRKRERSDKYFVDYRRISSSITPLRILGRSTTWTYYRSTKHNLT